MSRHRILVVDDEPDVTRMLAHVAERALAGAEVRTAASGEEALALLSADDGPEDEERLVILSDFNMGADNMNGLAFLAQVRERCPHARCVMITGYSREDLLGDGIDGAELEAFLTKPIDVRELMALLRSLTGRALPA